MRIIIQDIDLELWQIVENGYTIQHAPTPDDKAMLRLDAQATDIICASVSNDIFIRFRMLDIAKKL